jgi:hypothetical protein
MRVVQPVGKRGSLKWIQIAVTRHPELLQPSGVGRIKWVSPVADDEMAEYRDAAFLERLGLGHLAASLSTYWPVRGPQWDALGIADGKPVLVEAKAHLNEFESPGTKAGPASMAKISASLDLVRADLGVTGGADWSQTYYQFTNRIAHLWWLRRNGVDAHFLFVNFINDTDMRGPSTADAWDAAFQRACLTLGLPARHGLSDAVHHVEPDVRRVV